jgi:hypothetical protein
MIRIKIHEFTSEDYPSIVGIHNSLSIACPEQPRTPEGWAIVEKNFQSACAAWPPT